MLQFSKDTERRRPRPRLIKALGSLLLLCTAPAIPVAHGQSDDVTHEIANLSDPDFSIRQSAARTLSWMGDTRAVEPLILGLHDLHDPNLRAVAAFELGRFKDPRSINALIVALDDENQEVRKNAAEALGEFRDSRAVAGLIGALNSPRVAYSDPVAGAAAASLGRIGALSVDPLVAELESASPSIRAHAVEALAWDDDPRAFNAVAGALKDPDPSVRAAAAAGLNGHSDAPGMSQSPYHLLVWLRSHSLQTPGYTRDPHVIDLLIGALQDSDAEVKSNAAQALGNIRTARAVEPLLSLLNQPAPTSPVTPWKPPIQMTVTDALGKIGDPRAVDALIPLLGSPSEGIRQHAAAALGDIKDARALGSLIAALNDKSPSVEASAAGALGQIKDLRAVEPLVATLDRVGTDLMSHPADYNPTKFEALESADSALSGMSDSRAVSPILATLKLLAVLTEKNNPQDQPARLALPWVSRAVGKLGTAAVGALSAMSKDPDVQVRINALTALGATGDPGAIAPLALALDDDEIRVRVAAAQALGMLHDPRAEVPLMKALKDNAKEVRASATHGLCVNPSQWAANALIAALRDPDSGFEINCIIENVDGIRAPITDQFLSLLKDPDPRTRGLATRTLVAQIQPRLIMGDSSDPAIARVIDALLARLHEGDAATIDGAFVFFVLLGKPGTEPALIEALHQSNEHWMAESLLTCGNAKLEDAGRAWFVQRRMQPVDQIMGVYWGKFARRSDF